MLKELKEISLNDERSRGFSLKDVFCSNSDEVVQLCVLWRTNTTGGGFPGSGVLVQR